MRTSQLSVLKRLDNLVAGARARAAAAGLAASNRSSSQSILSPSDLTGTTTAPIIVAAMDLTPKTSALFQVDFMVVYTLSAADTVTWEVDLVTNVTAISGGASVGNFHYEQTTPLVVTGDAPSQELISVSEIATGNIAKVTAKLSGLVALAPSLTERQAIVLRATTAGDAHITAMQLTGSGYELP